MKQLIEYPLKEGGSILAEVELPETGGYERASRAGEVVKATKTFDDSIEDLTPVSQKIISKLRGLTDPPDEIAVEFGFKLGAKAGIVIASADVEANFRVTLVWKREQPLPPPPIVEPTPNNI